MTCPLDAHAAAAAQVRVVRRHRSHCRRDRWPGQILEAHEAAIAAGQSALEHARRAGELLIAAKREVGHGAWLPWLTAHCPMISGRTAQGYMRLPREWPALEAKAQRVADLPLREALKIMAGPREAHNSGDAQWFSPAIWIEAARQVMGAIDLDPASHPAANAVVQASAFFDREMDGLRQPWRGNIWLNPPYTNKLMEAFSTRLVQYVRSGAVTQAILLTNSATETSWFHRLAPHASAICFPLHRAKYWRADTRKQSSPLQGQALFYFGAHADRFAVVFGRLGLIFDPPRPQHDAHLEVEHRGNANERREFRIAAAVEKVSEPVA